MAPLARLRLLLLALLAIAIAGSALPVATLATIGAPDQPFYDQIPTPSQDGLVSDDDPFNLDDGPPSVAELVLAFGLYGSDARLRPIAGRDWLSCFQRFLTPFETGPPAA